MLKLVPLASVLEPLKPVKTKSSSVTLGIVRVLGTLSEHVGLVGAPLAQGMGNLLIEPFLDMNSTTGHVIQSTLRVPLYL